MRIPAPQGPGAAQRKKGAVGSSTVLETLALFRQGQRPEQIAQARGLTVRTIYNHLARLIADGKLELESVVSPDVITRVRAVAQEVGTERLSPIKERLPDNISFEEIACVVAKLRSEIGQPGG
jgi:ATP-dependent DNA helicase RecQ